MIASGDTLIGEIAANGTPTAAYTWGAAGLVSAWHWATGLNLFYHYGPQGETRTLTDASGNIRDTYVYTPYGYPVTSTGTDANPFQFGGSVGYYSDPLAQGLVLCGQRWYSPGWARWLSRDPAGYAGGAARTTAASSENPNTTTGITMTVNMGIVVNGQVVKNSGRPKFVECGRATLLQAILPMGTLLRTGKWTLLSNGKPVKSWQWEHSPYTLNYTVSTQALTNEDLSDSGTYVYFTEDAPQVTLQFDGVTTTGFKCSGKGIIRVAGKVSIKKPDTAVTLRVYSRVHGGKAFFPPLFIQIPPDSVTLPVHSSSECCR